MSYQAGLAHDPDNGELMDGLRRALDAFGKCPQGVEGKEKAERAMAADPEIRAIMSDPVMQRVLLDCSNNPTAAAVHMRNPDVAAKMQKLVDAGMPGMHQNMFKK